MAGKDHLPSWYQKEDDEDVIAVLHPHVYVYWEGILFGGLVIALALGFFFSNEWRPFLEPMQMYKVVGVAIGSGLLVIGYEYLQYRTTWYIITSTRVTKKKGIVSDNYDPLHMADIVDVEKRRSVVQRIFSTGDILMYSAGGTDTVDIMMENVPSAYTVYDRIEQQKNRYRPRTHKNPPNENTQSQGRNQNWEH